MRTKQLIWGLNNSQKVRVILDGFGMYMTVKDLQDRFVFASQRVAVWQAIETCVRTNTKGLATSYTFYDEKMQSQRIQVQVDLI
jgi:hypothetical protein